MKKFTFILGGARSGKSSYAVNVAKSAGKKIIFIATCIPGDKEMRHRIKLHKKSRPGTWKVIEEGVNIDSVLRRIKTGCDAILIDCIGLFISNLMAAETSYKKVENKIRLVIEQIKKLTVEVIVVSNEVGMGIVPDNSTARRFRDILGRANQIFAQNADTVIMMHAGIPTIIKGEKNATVE
ncbi:MAG: bifunctional adenosylcobinamide kinase/adenosylcobinamide-phosphate guanylyltransferase [Candidatus Omnitrophica bacterium]|nr:bifunctional adenosylcobinamide kinase/adenosylcobinamide-phosphate guanylyltransferase [Candidatus Omnitrophota bacterium]